MANEANIKAVITADDKASGILRGFGDNVNSVAGKIGSVLKTAAEGLAIAGAAAVAFGAASVKAFTEAEDGIAQTNAVLKSTANIAGVTADEVDKLSKSLQKQTKFSDEDVRSVENLLLTFTSIGKDVFPEATKTVLDMATALGEDTKSASIQLGKALQDPILGITALRRVGVNFSEDQKNVIQQLVETGEKAKAQQLILKELNTEFGGSAEAAGNTFSGSLAKLKNSLNDVQEKLGETIVKYITPFATKALEAVASIDWDNVIKKTIEGLKAFWKELDNVWQKIDRVYQAIQAYLEPKLVALKNAFLQDLMPALKQFWTETLDPLIEKLGPMVGAGLVWALGEVIDATTLFITAFGKITEWINNNRGVFQGFIAIFGSLAAAMAFNAVVAAFTTAFATITTVTIPALAAAWGSLVGLLTGPIVIPALIIGAAVASINSIKRAWDDVSNAANAAANIQEDAQIRQFQKLAAAARASGDQSAVTRYSNAIAALGGGRAVGGPVTGGVPYLVGEKGPEVVVPNSNGTVIPNNRLGGMGGTININLTAGAFMGSDVEARKFAQLIIKHYNDAMASKSRMVMA